MITVEDVLRALAPVIDPELRRSVVDLNMIRDVEIEGDSVQLKLALTTLACPLSDTLAAQVHAAISALPGVEHVGIDVTEMTPEEVRQIVMGLRRGSPSPPDGRSGGGQAPLVFSLDPSQATLPTSLARQISPVKHLIGVTSGKGGVGKSLVTALLAVALRREGYRVGIFDADITGASIPQLFGLNHSRMKRSPEGIIPVQSESGIRIVSANFMLKNPDDPVAWRGSRIAQLIIDLWHDVVWGPLDYLLFDFPPGTSDAQLTVMMDLPVQGLLMVTTPQELATLIVRKAIKMSRAMEVPLLGVVENMSYFVCPDTGTQHEIFGESHAASVSAQAGIALLARLPIEPALARACDAGRIEEVDFPPLHDLTRQVVAALETDHQTDGA